MSTPTHAPFDLVIYHANCLDGFAAAWAAHKHSPDAEFIPAKYGDDPPPMMFNEATPEAYGKRVLVVDFSYPRDILIGMWAQATELLVLDHHKTAAEDLAGLDFAVFDMERSGAGITWDELNPTQTHTCERPALIRYVEDRDLWRFNYCNTKAYIAALSVLSFDFDVWTEFSTLRTSDIVYRGEAILAFTQRTCEKLASRCCDAVLCTPYRQPTEAEVIRLAGMDVAGAVIGGGLQVLAVNCPPEFISDTADVLKPRADGRAIVGWFFDGERGDFVFSLRSADDGSDVSEIARAFGGGGHEHAAGFRLDHNPLVKA